MARLKDRSLPHSCEGSHQLVPWIDLFSLDVLFSDPPTPEFPFCVAQIMHTYPRGCTRTRASRKGLEWGCKRRVGLETGRVKPTCLASASHLTKLILRKVRLFCSLAKRSIDKIQWFEWNFILSSFHWNATMECEKVYELFSVAFLPSIAWGWVSNTLREWGTVKPNAYPLGTF